MTDIASLIIGNAVFTAFALGLAVAALLVAITR